NQTTTANITLSGQAPVTVIVRDGANQLVTGAQVTLNAAFGSSQQALTGADGTTTFPRVFVGGFNVSARNSATQLNGSTSGTAVLGSNTTITVQLHAYGSITGTVFAADGTTPASNVTVYLTGPVARSVANPPAGAFTFNTIPVGTYRLDAYDQFGNRRAFVQS